MPPTRRSRLSSGPSSKTGPGAQKTLSFSGSKPSSSVPSLPKQKSSLSNSITPSQESTKPTSQDIDLDLDLGHISSSAAVEQQAKVEVENVKATPEEEKARKVSDAQIKRFWRERENERISRRVHQGDLSVEEKVLRFWDMSSQFGVCCSFLPSGG
jgi:DNA polymerase delta subunit 4